MGSAALAVAVCSPSKSRGFPNTIATIMACALAGSGTLSVGCRTAASGGAIVGVAGRSCFGLSKGPRTPVASRLLCIGTSGCAPMSDACVAANRVIAMGSAPVSFAATGTIKRRVSGFRFMRLGGNGNCSRG